VALPQALGQGVEGAHRLLRARNRWGAQTGAADLPAEPFPAWCKTKQHLVSGVRRRHRGIVRHFCLYRHRRAPHCFVPNLCLFPAYHPPRPPYIFSHEDIARFLHVTDRLAPTSAAPLRAPVSRLAIVRLYTTGLRRGELVRRTVGDAAPPARPLLVRQSKFHQSRYFPLSDDTVVELHASLDWRRQHPRPLSPPTPLLWNGHNRGTAYTGAGLAQGLRHLCRRAEVRTADARLPRVHDVRHRFAVHALWRWDQADGNVRAQLPLLATYMGHVSIHSTAYSLPFIEVVAAAASERCAAHYGALVPPWAGAEGEPSCPLHIPPPWRGRSASSSATLCPLAAA